MEPLWSPVFVVWIGTAEHLLGKEGVGGIGHNRGLRERRDQAVREPDLLEQPGLGTGIGDGFGRRAASQGNAIA